MVAETIPCHMNLHLNRMNTYYPPDFKTDLRTVLHASATSTLSFFQKAHFKEESFSEQHPLNKIIRILRYKEYFQNSFI